GSVAHERLHEELGPVVTQLRAPPYGVLKTPERCKQSVGRRFPERERQVDDARVNDRQGNDRRKVVRPKSSVTFPFPLALENVIVPPRRPDRTLFRKSRQVGLP